MPIKELEDAAPLLENASTSDVAVSGRNIVITTEDGRAITGGDDPLITGQNCGGAKCGFAVVLETGDGPLRIEVGNDATFIYEVNASRADFTSDYVEDELFADELLVAGAY